MTALTLQEASDQLTQVQIAISDLISGKRLSELSIGSGATERKYKYSEITIDNLVVLRNELRSIINALQPDVKPIFRSYANIPIIVEKGNY
jgi:hypothetical protein